MLFVCLSLGQEMLGAAAVIRHDRDLAYFCYFQTKPKLLDMNHVISDCQLDLQIFNGHTAELSEKQKPSVYICKPGEPVKLPPSHIPNEELHRGQTAQPLLDHMKELIERQTFGLLDIDKERNFTVDVAKGSPLYLYFCNNLGFPVIDSHEFEEFEVDTVKLAAISTQQPTETSDCSVHKLSEADGLMLENFDAFIAGARRSLYLRYLIKKDGVECYFVRNAKGRCAGFIIFDQKKIFCLYASELAIAKVLLQQLCTTDSTATVTRSLYAVRGTKFATLVSQSGAKKLKSVRRLHSIFTPKAIKWDDIYVLNVGIHLV